MVYTLTLNPAIDYVVRLDSPLTPGDLNRSREEAYQFGGKGINVSNVLRTLDTDTIALGFIAGFTGEALAQGLQEMGLTTDFIPLPEGCTRINVKVKASQETEINGSGPKITAQAMESLYKKLESLTTSDVLVLSGSVPGSLGENTYADLLARAEKTGARTVVDASGQLLTNTLSFRPFLIKPNLQELEELFHKPLTYDKDILDCAATLQNWGAENVLVSMAADGALLLDETGKAHRIGCPTGHVVNSVGAGDSMVAGFLAGWLKTGDYAYALKLGTAAGSATAFSLGLADKKTIDTLMDSMHEFL